MEGSRGGSRLTATHGSDDLFKCCLSSLACSLQDGTKMIRETRERDGECDAAPRRRPTLVRHGSWPLLIMLFYTPEKGIQQHTDHALPIVCDTAFQAWLEYLKVTSVNGLS